MPETAMPILVPTAPDKADGFALNLELSSFRIEEQPLRQLKKMPKLEPGLWNEELMEVLRLVNAIKSQNQKEIASIVERIVRDGSVKLNGATASAEELTQPENLTRYIGAALTTSMQGSGGDVRFALWFDRRERRLRTGLLCPNERAAAFVMLLYNQHLKAARCPRCTKLFPVDSWHPRTFCSDRCKNAANFAAFYERQRTRKAKRRRAAG